MTKSDAIRKYIAKHPSATTKDVAKATKTNYSLVAQVRAADKKKKAKKKSSKRSPTRTVKKTTPASSNGLSRGDIVTALAAVQTIGSFEKARRAIDELEAFQVE